VVTGGAGFLGSHLCDRLLERGDEVVCVDDLSTGASENLAGASGNDRFEFVQADVCAGLDVDGPVDVVFHLASAASPPAYQARPLETLAAGSRGTDAALALARSRDARFVLTSTSEVYGDPLVHPQVETYWGNVNPVGPRSMYDEAKRFAEALTTAHRAVHGVDTGIVRIFNTYGPRLAHGDGRVVSTFVSQALAGEAITVYGDGTQTRSFCYVDDMIDALVRMGDSSVTGPVNIGNPNEFTIAELAAIVIELTGSASPIVHAPLPADDPTRRRPDVTLAEELLGWKPSTGLRDGLAQTIAWFDSISRSV
jgi:dTDP-glucose 4,6-dehydratase